MMNFALTLTANRDEAKDLLQETSFKVLYHKEKFVDNRNFKGWVLTVMRNTFINEYHRLSRTQAVIDSSIDLYNVDVINDADFDSPESSLRLQEITGAIRNLDRNLREPFVMYVRGYQYNEIADALHLPLGTIKSRIFFARKILKEQLKDFYYD